MGVVLALWLGVVVPARGDNWPRFRGPNGQGISDARTIPAKWSPHEYNWKIELPGGGHSSPVVWDDKVVITCADEKAQKGILLCPRAADGSEVWRKEYGLDKVKMNALNNYAAATPAPGSRGMDATISGHPLRRRKQPPNEAKTTWSDDLKPPTGGHRENMPT